MNSETIASSATQSLESFLVTLRDLIRGWCGKALQFRQRRTRALRLCDNLPLGEHRFIAVVQYEDSRFLVGGTSSALVLLAHLKSEEKIADPDLELQSLDSCNRNANRSEARCTVAGI